MVRLLLTTAIITSLVAPAYAGSLKDRAGTVSYRVTPAQITPSALNSISIATQLNSIEPAAGYKPSARVKTYSKGMGKNAVEDEVFYDDLQQLEPPAESVQDYTIYKDNSAIAPAPNLPQKIIPVPSSSIGKTRSKLKPRVEGNWRHSNDRSILMSEFWVPLAQNVQEGSVLFGDVRIMGDNNENKEFNAGLGYRKIVDAPVLGEGVAGGMLWFDRRRTARDSKFNQITAGAEWLGEDWDVRSNGYIPLNDSETHTQVNPNGAGAGFVGNQILVNTDQLVVEEALPGVDLEIGRRLDFMDGITDSTRVYAGGYHFTGDKAEDVTGWRARIASDITQDIQVGARFQDDDVRGSQTYLEATIRFPFKAKKSFKKDGLYSRLDEAPERDIDIVSNEAVIEAGLNQILLNAVTRTEQNVIHVDNTNGAGTGTAEDPFNTLAAAQVAAGVNDLIYVHRGDGLTTGQNVGIVLDDAGQMLVGSGTNLLFSASRFTTGNGQDINGDAAVLIAADSTGAPVITNAAGQGVDITADDVFVSGITVDGADTGLRVNEANNAIVSDNSFINSTNNGLTTIHTIGTNSVTVKNNIVSNNLNHGLRAFANVNGNVTLNIEGNTAMNNTTRGFRYFVGGNSSFTLNSSRNVASGNNTGFEFDDESTGSIEANMSFNSSFSNITNDLHVDLDGAELQAENNWWGSVTGLSPAALQLDDASTADTTPFLTSDPNL